MSAPRLARLLAGCAAAALAAPALAAPPRVVVDIAPLHSIVASVMGDLGAPRLIVPPGTSEHGHALRPSEAAALQEAEVAIWIGPALTPWLEGPLDALAPEARRLVVLEAPGLRLLDLRVGGPFEAHAHDEHEAQDGHETQEHGHAQAAAAGAGEGHDHGNGEAAAADGGHAHEDEHAAADAHEDGDEHAAADAHTSGDAHAEAGGGHAGAEDGHAEHAGADPHAWLDPLNGAAIAAAVAETLAAADPENAATYAANAAAVAAEMEALTEEIAAAVAPLRGRPYFVFHDAYLYFEDRFDLPAAGAIALGDAEAPRAGRVAEIHARFDNEAIVCVFAEPQFEPRLIETLIEGTDTRTGTLDPIGAGLEPGPGLYPALLRGLAADLAACLDPGA
jgi:zinc transport system substrate-binding protein